MSDVFATVASQILNSLLWLPFMSVKELFVPCGWDMNLKRWSLYLLDNLSYCLICAPENFQVSSTGFKPMTPLTNWAIKPLECEQVNLLVSYVPVKGIMRKRIVCVRALHRHRNGHVFESHWGHLKFVRCTYMRQSLRLSSKFENYFLKFIHVCVRDNVRDRVCVRDHGWKWSWSSFNPFWSCCVRRCGTDRDRNFSFYTMILPLVVKV